MAEPVKKENNKFFKRTNKGIYTDTRVNLTEIIKRAFRQTASVKKYEPKDYSSLNPDFSIVKDVPSLYIWIEGGDRTSSSIGQNRGHKVHTHKNIYVHVMYIYKDVEEINARDQIEEIGSFLEDTITDNLNLNDLFDGPSELAEVTFPEKLFNVGDQLRLVQVVHLKVIYKRQEKRILSKR